MRSIFGVLSLLIVVAIVGVLAKKQMTSINEIKVPAVASEVPGVTLKVDPNATVQQQSQQIQQQFKAAAEAAVQQPRAMPDDKLPDDK